MTPAFPLTETNYVFAEDIGGIWHVRRDDYWANDINADVRAHAICGDIWSCHVSQFPPVLADRKARHCRECFPVGRRRRTPAGTGEPAREYPAEAPA